jgi:hypothetical protein
VNQLRFQARLLGNPAGAESRRTFILQHFDAGPHERRTRSGVLCAEPACRGLIEWLHMKLPVLEPSSNKPPHAVSRAVLDEISPQS